MVSSGVVTGSALVCIGVCIGVFVGMFGVSCNSNDDELGPV